MPCAPNGSPPVTPSGVREPSLSTRKAATVCNPAACAYRMRLLLCDWVPVSRPQIYYSLDKLTKLRLIRTLADDSPSAGPERRVFETTALGRDRLADALEGKHWVIDRVHQPFLIWLALSGQARPRATPYRSTSQRSVSVNISGQPMTESFKMFYLL
jgi:DNA-binding PadR family transcriptional regulator